MKGAGGAWPKEVTLFLFDRQLVYCKKDIIKRNTYVYRGRINLDLCSLEDITENKGKTVFSKIIFYAITWYESDDCVEIL